MPENRNAMLWGLFALQALCTVFFLGDTLADMYAPDQDGDGATDIMEWLISFALAASTAFTGLELRRSHARERRMSRQLDVASGAFAEVLERHFLEWRLTPAERDVALMALKGYSVADMARIRGASEGTVKAQNAAIYRKAGVTGRLQLLSLFVEDLMAERLVDTPDASRPSGAPAV